MNDGGHYAVMLKQLEIIELDFRARNKPLSEQERNQFVQIIQLMGSNSQIATLLAEGGIVMNQNVNSTVAQLRWS